MGLLEDLLSNRTGVPQGRYGWPEIPGFPVPIPQGPQQLPPEVLETLLRSMGATQPSPSPLQPSYGIFDMMQGANGSPSLPSPPQLPSQYPPLGQPEPTPPIPQMERQAAEQFELAKFSAPPAWMQNPQQEFFSPNVPPPPAPSTSLEWLMANAGVEGVSPETEAQAEPLLAQGRADYEGSRQAPFDRQRAEMNDRELAGLQRVNSRFEPTPSKQRYQEMMASDQTSQQRGTAFSRNPELLAEFHKATAAMDQQRQEEEAVAHQAWKDTFDQDRADVAATLAAPARPKLLTDEAVAGRQELFAAAQGTRDARQEELRMRGKRKGANLTARQRGVPLPSGDTVARNDRIDRGVATMSDYAMADVPPEQMEIIQNENPQFRRDKLMEVLLANPGLMEGASFDDLMSLINGDGGGGIRDPENNALTGPIYATLPAHLQASLAEAIQNRDPEAADAVMQNGHVDRALADALLKALSGDPGARTGRPTGETILDKAGAAVKKVWKSKPAPIFDDELA